MIWREIEDQAAVLAQTREMMATKQPPNWHKAWQEHLNLLECGDEVKPAYVGKSSIHRYQGRYIQALVPDFEERWRKHFREWLFRTFLSDVGHLYEFGAGSCENLVAFREQFPDKEMTALDFAEAALDIAGRHRIWSAWFDLRAPDFDRDLEPNSAVLTFDALEQIGSQFWPFLGYLLDKRPKRIIHVEPWFEGYGYSAFDEMAAHYHLQREYLRGLFPALQLLNSSSLNLLYCKRMGFGSRFHEGYSVAVWEPR
jgi:hypothetical protein